MPEESLETHELKEQLEEAIEKGEGRGWLTQLSLSTAVIAVIAAIASLQAGANANEALVLKNDAVLAKASASDKYNEYELRKIKGHIYAAQIDALPPEKKDLADKFRATVERETAEGKKPFEEARRLDAESEEKNAESEASLKTHEIFARSVTVFQVAIALSAIAALTRRRAMWLFSMALGLVGLFFFVQGHLPHAKGKGESPVVSAPAGEP
jgi:hypothetical protein